MAKKKLPDHPVEYFTQSVPAIRNMIPAIHHNDTDVLISVIRI